MSRGCSGGACAATTTTTRSTLAAIARRRCGTCGSARASRLRRGSTAVTRCASPCCSTSTWSPTASSLCWRPARSGGRAAGTSRLEPSSPSSTVQAPATMPVTTPRSPAAAPCPGVPSGPSSSSAPTSSRRKSSSSSRGPPGLCVLSAALRSLAARLVSLFRSPVSSSASRLLSRLRCFLSIAGSALPSGSVTVGRAGARPGASPARAVGRDVRAARVPRKRRSGGAEAAYDRALELGDAGIPLTALAVITSPPSAGGSGVVLQVFVGAVRRSGCCVS